MYITKKICIATLFIFFLSPVQALEKTLELAFSNGGHKLFEVRDAETLEERSPVLLGDGFSVSFGLRKNIFGPLSITSSFGYKLKSNNFVDGTTAVSSFPITLGIKSIFAESYGIEVGGINFYKGLIYGHRFPNKDKISSNVGTYVEFTLISEKTLEIGFRSVNSLIFTHELSGLEYNGNHGSIFIKVLF